MLFHKISDVTRGMMKVVTFELSTERNSEQKWGLPIIHARQGLVLDDAPLVEVPVMHAVLLSAFVPFPWRLPPPGNTPYHCPFASASVAVLCGQPEDLPGCSLGPIPPPQPPHDGQGALHPAFVGTDTAAAGCWAHQRCGCAC